MTDRTDGYVTDIDYTHGYYVELNPLRMRLALLNAGARVPDVATACELGFGQGLSLNIHAAASRVRWYGTDFNAAHAGAARQLAAAAGTDIGLYRDSFEDFGNRPSLPTFDYIGLHGVWSWISDRNRAVIVDFVRRKLKPGGVLYIDYNTLPGWAAFSPIRHLLVEHANRAGTEGRGIAQRIDDAVNFLGRLLATHPEYARNNPQILDHFKALKTEDRRYLAHEYFNRDWEPMHFATVAQWLGPAQVSYACSSTFADHVEALNLTEAQRHLLGEIHDPGFRESVRDFAINQRFRRDYWISGAPKLSEVEWTETLRRERVISVTHLTELPFELRAALALNKGGPGEAVIAPVLALLADHKARTLGEMEHAVRPQGIDLKQIVETVVLAASCNHIAAAQDEATTAHVRAHTDRLNAHLIERARTSDDVHDLASPVTGGGIHVGRAQQLFLSALRQGKTHPHDWAREAAKIVDHEGDLAAQAQTFAQEMLPILRALQVI